MKTGVSEEGVQRVVAKLIDMNFNVHRSTGVQRTILGAIGDQTDFDPRTIEALDDVREVVRITKPYKLASRNFKREDTVVEVGGGKIGGEEIVIIAGVGVIEAENQINTAAEAVSKTGARILLGNVYAKSFSPHDFQGLGEKGWRYLYEAGKKFGLGVMSEIRSVRKVAAAAEYVDIFLVGAQNIQNFELLGEIGKLKKPVVLKRGFSATLEETLISAEHIMSQGNYNVILCESGVRTFGLYKRNTLDIAAVSAFQQLSHLPVIVDPSQCANDSAEFAALCKAAVVAGSHGLIIKAGGNAKNVESNAAYSVELDQFEKLTFECSALSQTASDVRQAIFSN